MDRPQPPSGRMPWVFLKSGPLVVEHSHAGGPVIYRFYFVLNTTSASPAPTDNGPQFEAGPSPIRYLFQITGLSLCSPSAKSTPAAGFFWFVGLPRPPLDF
jgi:hypothetical protein